MRICCFVGAASTNRKDQYATCRGEGRAIINTGFGLGLMGHETDIIYQGFEDGYIAADNVTLRKQSVGEYDVALTYNYPPPMKKYKKLIYFVEPSNLREYFKKLRKDFPDACFVVAARKAVILMEDVSAALNLDLKHLSTLFPIPTYQKLTKQDFQDFTFDKSKKDINVFTYISGWPNYYLDCDDRILEILQRLRDRFGYNINLTLLRGGSGNPFSRYANMIVTEFEPKILYNDSLSYLDILNMISEQDICITKGGWCYCGMCSYDIVSLGKLMLYVTVGPVHDAQNNINDMYSVDEYVFRHEDGISGVHTKLNRIMEDPATCYKAFRDAIDVHSFPLWSKQMEALLVTLEGKK